MNLHAILEWLKAKLGGQSMPNLRKPEIADIEVTVKKDPADPTNILFGFPTKQTGKVKHWKNNANGMFHVSFENQGAGGFIVLFNIKKDDGTDCVFHSDPAQAMYCHGQPTCPPPPNSSWDKFVPIGVINGGKTLIVYNKNDERCSFGFVLRFTSNRGDQEFDPIGEDMNG